MKVQYLPGTDLPTSITGGGKTWTCQYYPNGLPQHVSASGSPDADYTWDTMGRLCSLTLTPSAGTCSTTTWERDPQSGRLTCKKVNGVVVETYAWRANGQPDTVTRPNGTIQNQYNAAGDPTALVDTPANYAAETVTTAYDRPGNVVANAVVGGIAEAYTNYIDGTLLGVQVSGNGVVPDHANAWPLNFATGQALGCILTQGGTVRNLAVFYNAASCVTNLIDGMVAGTYAWTPGGSATNITWTVAGVPCLTLQSGWNEALGVRTNMAYFVNGVPLASFAFSRGNGTSQITRITREDGSTRAVTYDNSGRLAGWKYRNAAGVADYDRSWLYSYDGAGNLLSSGHDPSVAGGPTQMSPMAKDYATKNIRTTSQFDIDEFNFNAVRRWNAVDLVCYASANARVTVNGMPARQNGTRFVVSIPLASNTVATVTNLTVCAVLDGGTNAEYYYTNTVLMTLPAYPETIQTALASAITGDSVRTFTFDARNQLRQVTDCAGATPDQLQSTFDLYPDGRRARKTVTCWDGSAWQPRRTCQYIYQGWNLVREIVVEDGTTTTRDYTWGLDLTGLSDGQWGQDAGGIGGLLAITEVVGSSTNIFLPICDHVGTVHMLIAAMTNSVLLATPAVVATYEYSPWGDLIAVDGRYAGSCPLGFMSKFRDCETGLLYFGKRFYNPKTGTWLTADPSGEAGGANLTVAFADDPVNSVDPLGLMTAEQIVGELAELDKTIAELKEAGATYVGPAFKDPYGNEYPQIVFVKSGTLQAAQLLQAAYLQQFNKFMAVAEYAQDVLKKNVDLSTLNDQAAPFLDYALSYDKYELEGAAVPGLENARNAGWAAGQGRTAAAVGNGALAAVEVVATALAVAGPAKNAALGGVARARFLVTSVAEARDALAAWYARQPISSRAGRVFIPGLDEAAQNVPRVTEKGLARVEQHLNDVLKNQDLPIEAQAGERGMLERLRSGNRQQQDTEFYLHELRESARFRTFGDLLRAHAEALKWRSVTPLDLFHPEVIEANPEVFSPAWRGVK